MLFFWTFILYVHWQCWALAVVYNQILDSGKWTGGADSVCTCSNNQHIEQVHYVCNLPLYVKPALHKLCFSASSQIYYICWKKWPPNCEKWPVKLWYAGTFIQALLNSYVWLSILHPPSLTYHMHTHIYTHIQEEIQLGPSQKQKSPSSHSQSPVKTASKDTVSSHELRWRHSYG